MSKPLISRRESIRYPGLFVEKYSKKVFWDSLWNEDPALVESRGVVKNADGDVVIRPFTKIFNRGENGADIDRDEKVLAVCKVNGFMAAATYVPEYARVIVSTTGSLDSPFVDIASEWLEGAPAKFIEAEAAFGPQKTWLFEIVDPSDPHIIPEEPGAYLIGSRLVNDPAPYFSGYWQETGLDIAAEKMGVMRPGWAEDVFSNVVHYARVCHHEGYVVYGLESKTVIKIKSPYYLALKAAARIKDISTLDKRRVDEEFYPIIDLLYAMGDDFNKLTEQDRLRFVRQSIYGYGIRNHRQNSKGNE